MIAKKNFVAVLLAFYISSIMFVALPTRSQTSSYDPWADVSGPTIGEPDGTINMRDIQYEIMLFNTHGTPIDRAEILRTPDITPYNNTEYVYPRSLHLNFTEIYILGKQGWENETGIIWGGWDTRSRNVTYTLSLNMAFFDTYASSINWFYLGLSFNGVYELGVSTHSPVQNITVNGKGCLESFIVPALNNSVNWLDTSVFGNVRVAELST
jgi:hypothetical protein